MRLKKVLFFFPAFSSLEATAPLGILAVAAPLLRAGYQVRIIDSTITRDFQARVLAEIEGSLCLAISLVTGPMIRETAQIARESKRLYPRVPVILGSKNEVERVTAEGAEGVPSVWRAYTRAQLLEGRVPPDPWSRRVLASFDRERSGDVDILLDPYWMAATGGTTHGTPFSYDTHIPLVIMGPGIRPGRYDRPVLLNDLAPTLATLLSVETPSGASGQPLAEILVP